MDEPSSPSSPATPSALRLGVQRDGDRVKLYPVTVDESGERYFPAPYPPPGEPFVMSIEAVNDLLAALSQIGYGFRETKV